MSKIRDLTGQQFGRLTVKACVGRDKWGNALWLCDCECKKQTRVSVGCLTSGATKSCGCLQREVRANAQPPHKVKDLTDQKFGRLTARAFVGIGKHGCALWLCDCECGKQTTVQGSSLTSRQTKSCGCLHNEAISRPHPPYTATHGMTNTKVWIAWQSMRRRCDYPRAANYSLYGGRGIKVCDRWNSFESFLDDMGEPPTPEHSLDRIDTNGDYEPENCRWATRKEQQNNKRNNRILEYNGESHTVTEWAARSGIQKITLFKRLQSGWAITKALTTPVRANRSAHYRRMEKDLSK